MKSIVRRNILATLGMLVAATTPACSGCRPIPPPAPLTVDGLKCKVQNSELRPLIVEWSGMDRTDLEAAMHHSMIAVHYSGCELEVLRGCAIPDSNYDWVKTTREEELLKMDDVDQLYAKMPLAGPSLEAHFAQGNALRLSTTVIGKFVSTKPSITFDSIASLGPECRRATHVVIGATAGAFEMSTISKIELGAKAASFAGGETKSLRDKLRKSGNGAACDAAKKGDPRPPEDCGALLRLELASIKCQPDFVFKEGVGCIEAAPEGNADQVLAGDPHDFRLARFVLKTGRTLRDAYLDKKTDKRWHCMGKQDIQEPVRDDAHVRGQLGQNPEIVFSAMKFQLTAATTDGANVHLDALAFVFPDGRLRWAGLDPGKGGGFGEQFAVQEYPDLRVGLDRLLNGVKQCELALAEANDFEQLPIPQSAKSDLASQTTKQAFELRKWCKTLPAVSTEWRVAIATAAIAIVGNGKFALVDAEAERQDHDFCLKPATLREK